MKKWVSLFFAVVFAFALASVAYAHSGGTDSRGGHKNHSTGEYHYHHGYSAHQHEDLDGDGDLDCPFNFADKTGQSSGSTSGSYRGLPIYTPEPTPKPTPMPEKKKETSKSVLVVYFLMVGWAVVAFVGCLYLYIIRPIIRTVAGCIEDVRKAKEHKQQQKRLRQIEKEFAERYKNGLF